MGTPAGGIYTKTWRASVTYKACSLYRTLRTNDNTWRGKSKS
jgi:hypothetical protein